MVGIHMRIVLFNTRGLSLLPIREGIMKKTIAFLLAVPMTCLFAYPTGSEFLSFAERGQIIDLGIQPAIPTLDEAAEFVMRLKKEIHSRYGVNVDISRAIDFAKQVIVDSFEFSVEEKTQLISACDELQRIMMPKRESWSFGRKKKRIELELPPKMATGFMCMLGGALLCIVPIPGIQAAGAFFVTSGAALALEGFSSGEKPYHVDTTTGNKYDIRTGQRLSD
jgi:hypothetical protein